VEVSRARAVLNPHAANAGTNHHVEPYAGLRKGRCAMDSIIYLVGLVVVIMFVLSVLGLR
jgi:hypothetical protein